MGDQLDEDILVLTLLLEPVEAAEPFKVTQTQVHTLKAGDGPVVADDATVTVCYMGVNGRDGSVFDSSYQRGEPVNFPLNRVVPGFQKAIAGRAAVSMEGKIAICTTIEEIRSAVESGVAVGSADANATSETNT